MAELTTQVLIEIRDEMHGMRGELRDANARLDGTNARLDEANARLGVLARLTQSIDGRLEEIGAREDDRVFLPQRVTALEARVDRLQADRDA